MMPPRVAGFALFLTLGSLNAETITEEDRAYLIDHLRMTRQLVVNAARGLSPGQLLWKPLPHRWSAAQCIDHIARSEDYIVHKMVRRHLLQATSPINPFTPTEPLKELPPGPPPSRMGNVEDGLVIRAMTDRTRRRPASVQGPPPPVEEINPSHDENELARALTLFLEVRDRTIDYVRTTQDDLRGHWAVTSLPVYAPAQRYHDGYQWILRMSAHTERHLQQLEEVRQTPGFPAR